jgi:NAD(P)-dependent dehydrogenase (short-subunit alcohol dehydrogenase family)
MSVRSRTDERLRPEALFDLTGVGAVITGAARGIGRAAAVALASFGAEVLLFDILGDELERTSELVAKAGGQPADVIVGDVTSERDRTALIEAAAGRAPTGVLVNCAGIVRRGEIAAMTLEDFDALWDVNVRGTVGVTQAFLPGMIERGRGKVINLGSLGSVTGLERRTAYATSKGAVALYTKSLAHEVGRYGICVNAIAPGYIETEMTTDWILGDAERTAQLIGRIPLGRFGTTEDITGLLIFLASHASDYVTGQVIMLDGGWTTT